MTAFDWFASGFAVVAVFNLVMIPKRGSRAIALAVVAALCTTAAYLWPRTDSAAPKWVLAGAIGVLLASGLYESAKAKNERK